jgi:hypothetical protein
LFLVEKYGEEEAQKIFNHFDKWKNKNRGYYKKSIPSIISVLKGKISYIKQVKGADDPTYIKLESRFSNLLKGQM